MSNQQPLDYQTLLPDNRTSFERAFEEGMKDLAQTEEVYTWLHDPMKTKAALLDIMAKESGVKDWFSDDSEEAKRQSVAMAYRIMQNAGKRSGLKAAIEALGVTAQVTKGSNPYELIVEGRLSSEPLTPEMSQRINARVLSYKSERDTVGVTLSRSHHADKKRALLLQRASLVRVKAAVPVPPLFIAEKFRTLTLQQVKSVRIKHG